MVEKWEQGCVAGMCGRGAFLCGFEAERKGKERSLGQNGVPEAPSFLPLGSASRCFQNVSAQHHCLVPEPAGSLEVEVIMLAGAQFSQGT